MGSILPSLAIPTVSAKERERKGRTLFCVGQGSIAVLPLNAAGRNTHFPNISGHTGVFLVLPCAAIDCTFIGFVNDFEFSPFYDNHPVHGRADGSGAFAGFCGNLPTPLYGRSSYGPFPRRA